MRIGEANKPFECHTYEIELQTLYSMVNIRIAKNPVIDPFLIEYQKSFKTNIKGLIDSINKDYKISHEVIPVVIDSTDNIYEYFLSLSLAIYPIHKIEFFLDYHYKNYNQKGKYGFLDRLEFLVLDSAEFIGTPFDDIDKRLEIISQWLLKTKSTPVVNKSRNDDKSNFEKLNWIAEKSLLKRLSRELKNAGYIKRLYDFQNVFTKGNKINWYGSPEYLSYLFYKITLDPFNWINSKGKSPYTKSVQYFFLICDNSGKIAIRNDLSKVLNNVIKRSSKKHLKLRSDIDSMLSRISK